MNTGRIIRVTGKGRIRIAPDVTRVFLTLSDRCAVYQKALEDSAKNTGLVRALLTEQGFDPQDLKTVDFSVDPEYEGYEVRGVYKRRLAGYRCRHEMKIEFSSDAERLGKILTALAGCSANPELSIGYAVRDPEKAKNELLSEAMRDAREKARVLAEAAGLALGQIASVDYSWREIEFEARPVRMEMLNEEDAGFRTKNESIGMDVTPDELETTDVVTVV
ncbi:MAG: SIMPL domain-containing protein, partial [Clostridia bacterium]|nr:SIMPL domain-containing protein [Clostridia bacterium]